MRKFMKALVLAAVAALGLTTFASAQSIGEQEALNRALARVPGATQGNVTEFGHDYDHGRLEYEGEIRYNGYEYDFEIDAASGNFTKWEVERKYF
ncbi:Propeptide PepSY amd peptidase M4 [Veillonella parvula DSM 2008]|uniref:PepSY domain-containing protein n=1 Tax=Veillonella parvula TaxID=29466 RepID=UPI00019C0554|nr:PepSY domain-containing protein [Veillonella parvula]ACZ25273.1 Propeptide PepSY amd peptidase M4 [Veillonella parvula DSM 2008]QQB17267.1 PepSY domain-containing protein [Veillonella parvula]SNV01390.1 Peptidase propeptide and YPEB domain [Veillonella parvula]